MVIQPPREKVNFYFSFNDPYSFLITPAVKELAKNYKVDVNSIPLGGYGAAGVFSPEPAVQAYWRRDLERFSALAGRKLNYIPAVQDSTKVRRGLFMAEEKLLGAKYINLVFAFRWTSGGDISDIETVIKWLAYLELKEEGLKAAMESDMFDHELAGHEALAVEEGVIGVPFFTFRGEGFLGADRFGALETALKGDPSLLVRHDASYGVISSGDLDKKLNDGLLDLALDVRLPKDFSAGHIPGANCIPAKVVYRSLEKLDKKWSIALIDDGGVDANETAFLLASEGFVNVSVLSGGFPSWKGAVEKGLENWHSKLKA